MKKPLFFAFIGLLAALQVSAAWAETSSISSKDSVLPQRPRLVKKMPTPVSAPAVVDESLSEEQLANSMRVNRGDAQCEFSQTVSVRPHPQRPGVFNVSFNNHTYTMAPESTSTGAVRLEDKRAGVMWLQIPTKSMLMDSGKGQRMVDACTHAEQRATITANALTPGSAGAGIGIVQGAAAPVVANNGRAPSR